MSRGGFRPGAGRRKNSGSFGEKTVARRIPESLAPALDNYLATIALSLKPSDNVKSILPAREASQRLPFFTSRIAAGSPDHGDDQQEYMNLNDHLIPSPTSSFMVQVTGDSMMDAGIHHDDLLIVNREISPKDGHVVIAAVNGEMTVKQLALKGNQITLMPANPDFTPLTITESMDFRIWGVVTSVIHQL